MYVLIISLAATLQPVSVAFHWAPLSKVCAHLCKLPLGHKPELAAGKSSVDFYRWFDPEQPLNMLSGTLESLCIQSVPHLR